MRPGPGQCATCHEASQARKALDEVIVWFEPAAKGAAIAKASGLEERFTIPKTAVELDQYAKRLDQVFAGEGEGLNLLLKNPAPGVDDGDFTHGDHGELSCEVCHGEIPSAAAADVGTGAIDPKGCNKCHLKAGGEPNEPSDAAVTRSRPSWSLGAFAHSDHYGHVVGERKAGVCTEEAYAPFENGFDATCQHCHKSDPERPGYKGRDFPFLGSGPDGEGSKHRYQDCQLCHKVPGWQTGEGGWSGAESEKDALHWSSREVAVGEGALQSGWVEQRCDACHVFGQPDMAGTRPQEEIQRWRQKQFVFKGQTHPFITGSPEVLDKDCSECHRAVVPSLPTRLIDKKFHHATHLPPADKGFDNAQCVRCHKSSTQSAASASLADMDFRTYDITECAKCHQGSEVTEKVVAEEQPKEREVVSFPHQQHVAHMQCTVCHTVSGEDVETKPAALLCNDCHNHVSAGEPEGLAKEIDFDKLRGGLQALHHIYDGEAESCAKCHHEPTTPGRADVPAIRMVKASDAMLADARYNLEVEEFAGFEGDPFHPREGECTECHKNNAVKGGDGKLRLRPIIVKPPQQFVFVGSRVPSFHVDGTDTAKVSFKKEGVEVGCMSCHWKGTKGSDRIGNNRQYRPESAATRRALGNDFANYPGIQSRGRTSK